MRYVLLLLPLLFLTNCGEKNGGNGEEIPMVNFDHQAMLSGWVDNFLLPGHRALDDQLSLLQQTVIALQDDPTALNLEAVKGQFYLSYRAYQNVSPLIIAKAEEIRFREQFNTYPTDTELIEENILDAAAANLELPSNTTAQGLPAIEYLLYARGELLLTDAQARVYLGRLTDRLVSLNTEVITSWEGNFRDVFIQNDGNSATASIDRSVNDFIFHYEKFLRAGKVGIPAGVFSDVPLADKVEARYGGFSRLLLSDAFTASSRFFLTHGLKDYLDALAVKRDGELLSAKIKAQYALALGIINGNQLNDNLSTQVRDDNTQMLRLYDEMQKLVVLLKVDMLQALSINVDYVDADGD